MLSTTGWAGAASVARGTPSASAAFDMGGGEDEVRAGGPGVGVVTQALAGQGVEVLGEAGAFAQGPEPGADVVGERHASGAAQPVLDEHSGRCPDRAAPVAV